MGEKLIIIYSTHGRTRLPLRKHLGESRGACRHFHAYRRLKRRRFDDCSYVLVLFRSEPVSVKIDPLPRPKEPLSTNTALSSSLDGPRCVSQKLRAQRWMVPQVLFRQYDEEFNYGLFDDAVKTK